VSEQKLPRPVAHGHIGYGCSSGLMPEAKLIEIAIDDIDVPPEMRAIDEGAVEQIVESICELGLQAQGVITVRWNGVGAVRRATLITGRHRLEAFRCLGWQFAPAALFDGTTAEAEAWRISENLHRKELTALERAEQMARWMELRTRKKPGQPDRVFWRARASRRRQRSRRRTRRRSQRFTAWFAGGRVVDCCQGSSRSPRSRR